MLHLCGGPDHVESRTIYRSRWEVRPRHQWRYRSTQTTGVEVPVWIETWTYDPGPTQFIRYLHFEDDVLMNITTGRRGYGR